MNDVNCPYCDAELEINHDDGYGYEEDEIYTQECSECGKTFTYTTSISFYYEAEQAPCQNGEEHRLKPMRGYPSEFYEGKIRCEWCGEEFVDETVNKPAIERYFKKLEEMKGASHETKID